MTLNLRAGGSRQPLERLLDGILAHCPDWPTDNGFVSTARLRAGA